MQVQIGRFEHDQQRNSEKRVAELRDQLRSAELEDQPQERELEILKRKAVRESEVLKWEAIREVSPSFPHSTLILTDRWIISMARSSYSCPKRRHLSSLRSPSYHLRQLLPTLGPKQLGPRELRFNERLTTTKQDTSASLRKFQVPI